MFNERLKKLRNSQGISQVEFAKRFNISTGTIGNWEVGKREPDFETIKRIADYFDVSVDYLLGRTDYPHSEKKEPAELTTDSVMYELKKRGLYDKLNAMSDDDRQAVLATLDTLCEQLSKNRK